MPWKQWIASVVLALMGTRPWLLAAAVDPAPATPPALQFPAAPTWPGSDRFSLAAGTNGVVYLSWLEPVGGPFSALKFSTLAGARWAVPKTIADSDDWSDNHDDVPRLVPQHDGTLLAHWLQNRGLPGDHIQTLRVVRSADGSQWYDVYRGRPETSAGWPRFVSLFRDRGDATGVFVRDDRSGTSLQIATFGLANRRVADVPPLAIDSCDAVAVATTGATTAIAYRHASHADDLAFVRFHDGRWVPPVAVSSGAAVVSRCSAPPPAVAAVHEAVAVAWLGERETGPAVRVALSHDHGASFAASLTVESGRPLGTPAVVTLADGSAIVSWYEGTAASPTALYARQVWPTGRLGRTRLVAALSEGRATDLPQMVHAGDAVVVAWRDRRVRTAIIPLDLLAMPDDGGPRRPTGDGEASF